MVVLCDYYMCIVLLCCDYYVSMLLLLCDRCVILYVIDMCVLYAWCVMVMVSVCVYYVSSV